MPEWKRSLNRFDLEIDQLEYVVHSKSGEVVLRPEAVAAAKLIRKHISNECWSVLEGVTLYLMSGTTAGATTTRCVRGTDGTKVNLGLG